MGAETVRGGWGSRGLAPVRRKKEHPPDIKRER